MLKIGIFLCIFVISSTGSLTQDDLRKANLNLSGLSNSQEISSSSKKEAAIRESFESKIYRKWPTDFKKLSDSEMNELFNATYLATTYTRNTDYFISLKKVFSEIESRNRTDPLKILELKNEMINQRDFSSLFIMNLRYPNSYDENYKVIGNIPTSTPRIIIPEVNSRDFKVQSINIKDYGTDYLIVISHPDCHFTRNAVQAIEKNPEIAKEMAVHSLWIAPQSGPLTLSSIKNWNSGHPLFKIHQVWKQEEWPAYLDNWSTPTFYYIHSNKVVKKITGWPQAGNLEDLREIIFTIRHSHIRT